VKHSLLTKDVSAPATMLRHNASATKLPRTEHLSTQRATPRPFFGLSHTAPCRSYPHNLYSEHSHSSHQHRLPLSRRPHCASSSPAFVHRSHTSCGSCTDSATVLPYALHNTFHFFHFFATRFHYTLIALMTTSHRDEPRLPLTTEYCTRKTSLNFPSLLTALH
jgi:hypothetical protein